MRKEKVASIFHELDANGNIPPEALAKFGSHAAEQALSGHYTFKPVDETVNDDGSVDFTMRRTHVDTDQEAHPNSVDPDAGVEEEHEAIAEMNEEGTDEDGGNTEQG